MATLKSSSRQHPQVLLGHPQRHLGMLAVRVVAEPISRAGERAASVGLFYGYGDSIYFHGDDLYINLFIPSRLEWKAKGMTITQDTRFPETDTTRLAVTVEEPIRVTLRARWPSWC